MQCPADQQDIQVKCLRIADTADAAAYGTAEDDDGEFDGDANEEARSFDLRYLQLKKMFCRSMCHFVGEPVHVGRSTALFFPLLDLILRFDLPNRLYHYSNSFISFCTFYKEQSSIFLFGTFVKKMTFFTLLLTY